MDSPIALNRRQSREIDAMAIDHYGFSGIVLMENAGRGVAEVLLRIDPTLVGAVDRQVVILCGKGNNGGDGFVVARHLAIRGVRAKVVLLSPSAALCGDARQNYEILTHCDVPLIELAEVTELSGALDAQAADAAWLVDAMLGTGAQGEPRGVFPQAIQWMNGQQTKRLALDVPSGLDCDTGEPAKSTVRGDHTCTFVSTKIGFAKSTAREYVGEVHVVSIGIPPGLVEEVVRQS